MKCLYNSNMYCKMVKNDILKIYLDYVWKKNLQYFPTISEFWPTWFTLNEADGSFHENTKFLQH